MIGGAPLPARVDVAVLGAGVAGAAAAAGILHHRPDLRVLLIDKRPWPRDKVCGGCLNPAGVALAAQLGMHFDQPGTTHTLSTTHTLPTAHALPVDEVRITCLGTVRRFAHPGGLAIDRGDFDDRLVRLAESRGARFISSARGSVLGNHARLWRLSITSHEATHELLARWVLVADGLDGRSLDPLGLPGFTPTVHPRSRFGLGARMPADGPSTGRIDMFVGRAGYVGLVDLPGGVRAVAAALDPGWTRRAGGPHAAIARTLLEAGSPIDADALTSIRGTPRLTRRLARVSAPGLFVVGDAAGYTEPFSGEGMTWSLAGAATVAALLADAPANPSAADLELLADRWSDFRRRAIHPRQRWSRLVQRGVRHPALLSLAMRGPAAFTRPAIESWVRRSARPYPATPLPQPAGAP